MIEDDMGVFSVFDWFNGDRMGLMKDISVVFEVFERLKFLGLFKLQGRLCQNFGRKSRPLVSGPSIGVMSEFPHDSSQVSRNSGRVLSTCNISHRPTEMGRCALYVHARLHLAQGLLEAHWLRSHENSEVKPVGSRTILGWVTHWEVAREFPETKP
ncbi:hypothetical protein L3X38_041997 [Prunus dulcis]|uniref:Uncharacterized protein n=1 Tax=Prunus dulcis TaxID=3755 RepID=A0AAD4UV27_PRUDU|nr:hypothetical protein L3X38_041997 [Prunus dulcis]